MIREVKIQNYKSIESLDLELGRVNVLIGENGCGKTNILEAIALASAAYSDKLDNEFLVSRGIRVTEPQLMRSAFDKENVEKNIEVEISLDNSQNCLFILEHDNKIYSQWNHSNIKTVMDTIEKEKNRSIEKFETRTKKTIEGINDLEKRYQENQDYLISMRQKIEEEIIVNLDRNSSQYKTTQEALQEIIELQKKEIDFSRITRETLEIKNETIAQMTNEIHNHFSKERRQLEAFTQLSFLSKFLSFCPNNTSLRIFEEEGQIQPLGIHGEGLFRFLRFLDMQEDKTRFNEIKERLRLISWFKDFEIPKDLFETERKINIIDKYLDRDLKYFDQRSSNEGFLFTLFYLALFVGEETSKFFAIDNIDNALNPKLCWRVVEELVELAKKYDKQVIFTTHNPAVLDGLDLDDDEQRLFVISRNKFGRTRSKRIFSPKKIEGQEPLELSEAFMRGYIGGMPQHF